MSIRSTAKAIIIDGGKVLLNKCVDPMNGQYYSLPGGGQEDYETLHDAVVRECLEETGYEVRPVRFAALFEEICTNGKFRERHPAYAHKMYHIFICEPINTKIKMPTEKDSMQIGIEWIEFERAKDVRILPKAVGEKLMSLIAGTGEVFIGSEYVDFNHG